MDSAEAMRKVMDAMDALDDYKEQPPLVLNTPMKPPSDEEVFGHKVNTNIGVSCRKCKALDLAYDNQQRASADEGGTVEFICRRCGHRFAWSHK